MSNTLSSGATLYPGEYLVSLQNYFTLTMQADGLLVERDQAGNVCSPTRPAHPAPNSVCTMQSDGHLVIKDPAGLIRYDSGTQVSGSYLFLQNNGEVDICAPNGAIISVLVQHILALVQGLQAFHSQLAVALSATASLFRSVMTLRELAKEPSGLQPAVRGTPIGQDRDVAPDPARAPHETPGVRFGRGDNGTVARSAE